MKILYGITKSNFGGAQRYVYDLASESKMRGHQVSVICGGQGSLVDKLRDQDIRVLSLPYLQRDISLIDEFRSFHFIFRTLFQEQPDVFHTNSSKMGGIGNMAARLAGVKKIIFTSHGLAYDEDRNLLAKGLMWLATWATFLFAQKVIVISRDTFDRARRLPFCSKKIHLIYNGIKEVNLKNRDDAKRELGITAFTSIVALGELVRNKGYRYLIEAMGLLKQRNKIMTLYIMGEGDERQSFEKLITKKELEDQVHLLGYVPNGSSYLRAFDIFTLTSVKEGLPYVLMEAAQAELAVIGSEIPGITDIIENGINGILVPPRDPETLLSSLILLHENPDLRKRLGTNLKASIKENFSFEKMFSKTLALY